MAIKVSLLEKILNSYKVQFTAAMRATSLGLCKRAIKHALEDEQLFRKSVIRKKKKRKKKYSLHELLEQWTRAETLARCGILGHSACIDYYQVMHKKEDEIRELLYGTSDSGELIKYFNLDIHKNKRTKKKKRRKHVR